jgi:plasmid maintenance system antidote protein VapI
MNNHPMSMTLGQFIKYRGYTIAEFARHVEYTREHISKVVHGRSRPSRKLKNRVFNMSKGAVVLE